MRYLGIRVITIIFFLIIVTPSTLCATPIQPILNESQETYHVVAGDKLWDIVGREWKLKVVGMYEAKRDVRIIKTPYSTYHLLPGTRIIGPAKYFKKHDPSVAKEDKFKQYMSDACDDEKNPSRDNTHTDRSNPEIVMWTIITFVLATALICGLIFIVVGYMTRFSHQDPHETPMLGQDLNTKPICTMTEAELRNVLISFIKSGLPNEEFILLTEAIAQNTQIHIIPEHINEKIALKENIQWQNVTQHPVWDSLIAIAEKSLTPHEQYEMLEQLFNRLESNT